MLGLRWLFVYFGGKYFKEQVFLYCSTLVVLLFSILLVSVSGAPTRVGPVAATKTSDSLVRRSGVNVNVICAALTSTVWLVLCIFEYVDVH